FAGGEDVVAIGTGGAVVGGADEDVSADASGVKLDGFGEVFADAVGIVPPVDDLGRADGDGHVGRVMTLVFAGVHGQGLAELADVAGALEFVGVPAGGAEHGQE